MADFHKLAFDSSSGSPGDSGFQPGQSIDSTVQQLTAYYESPVYDDATLLQMAQLVDPTYTITEQDQAERQARRELSERARTNLFRMLHYKFELDKTGSVPRGLNMLFDFSEGKAAEDHNKRIMECFKTPDQSDTYSGGSIEERTKLMEEFIDKIESIDYGALYTISDEKLAEEFPKLFPLYILSVEGGDGLIKMNRSEEKPDSKHYELSPEYLEKLNRYKREYQGLMSFLKNRFDAITNPSYELLHTERIVPPDVDHTPALVYDDSTNPIGLRANGGRDKGPDLHLGAICTVVNNVVQYRPLAWQDKVTYLAQTKGLDPKDVQLTKPDGTPIESDRLDGVSMFTLKDRKSEKTFLVQSDGINLAEINDSKTLNIAKTGGDSIVKALEDADPWNLRVFTGSKEYNAMKTQMMAVDKTMKWLEKPVSEEKYKATRALLDDLAAKSKEYLKKKDILKANLSDSERARIVAAKRVQEYAENKALLLETDQKWTLEHGTYRNVTETLKKVAKEYRDDMAYASTSAKKIDARTRSLGTDGRDFAPMLTLMGIEGKTREERNQDIDKKLEILEQAFTSPNPEDRKPYLDMIYNLIDTFDPATMDMNNEVHVQQLLQCMILNQTYAVKRNENLAYFNARYPTPQQNRLVDTKNAYIGKAIAVVKTNLHKIPDGVDEKGKNQTLAIEPGVTIFSSVPYTDPAIYELSSTFAKMMRDQAQKELDTGATPSNVYELPILDSMISYADKDVTEIPTYDSSVQDLFDNFVFAFFPLLNERQDKKMEGLMEAGLTDELTSLYVDGMPFEEFREKTFPGKGRSSTLNSNIIVNLLLNDRHQLDIVHPYRGDDGQMKYEAKTLKAAITPEQEKQYMLQQQSRHSWFRRTFFNWGPFRIDTLKDKLDRIKTDPQNDSTVKARYEKICANMKEKVEAGIAKKAEAARLSEKEDKTNQKKLDAAEKAKANLLNATNNAVEKYGENSPIGILGQQVKDAYTDLFNGVTNSPPFESVAEILAKQVLFYQIFTERINTDHQPGRLEQSLMGDTPETSKEKITAAVQNYAKDPALKELFFNLAGIEKTDKPIVNRDRVRNFIDNGGYRTLGQQYTEKIAEITKNQQSVALQPNKTLQQVATVDTQPKEKVAGPANGMH